MRIEKMITKKQLLTFKQILFVSLLEMYAKQYGEYAYWC